MPVFLSPLPVLDLPTLDLPILEGLEILPKPIEFRIPETVPEKISV
jgi:hypothetical protein